MLVPLPFGEATDWYRNALAAGQVRVTWEGREQWLSGPTVIASASARGAFTGLMRRLMAWAGIELVVRFERERPGPSVG